MNNEGQIQGKKGCERPRTVMLDWLLKTEEATVGYEVVRRWHKSDQAGVNEDENLPLLAEHYGRSGAAWAMLLVMQ